MDYFTAQFQ